MNQDIAKHIQEHWGDTHTIAKVSGVEIDLRMLKDNESVVYGDGKTFHYRLTEKPLDAMMKDKQRNKAIQHLKDLSLALDQSTTGIKKGGLQHIAIKNFLKKLDND